MNHVLVKVTCKNMHKFYFFKVDTVLNFNFTHIFVLYKFNFQTTKFITKNVFKFVNVRSTLYSTIYETF